MKEPKKLKNGLPEKNKELQKRRQAAIKALAEADDNLTKGFWIVPATMSDVSGGDKELARAFRTLMQLTRNKLINDKQQSSVINEILADVITGAYQDRIVAYSIRPTGTDKNSTEAIESIQRIRQKADMHLIRMIQAFEDMKRPQVKVVVKKAEQVNVADKQVNIAQSKESSK